MLNLNVLWGVALTVMVLACPLMMFGMMAMAALPFTRRWLGHRGEHMMCHGMMTHGSAAEDDQASRAVEQRATEM